MAALKTYAESSDASEVDWLQGGIYALEKLTESERFSGNQASMAAFLLEQLRLLSVNHRDHRPRRDTNQRPLLGEAIRQPQGD